MPTNYAGPVIVLGHTGFIGRALTHSLRQHGADVHGFASSDMDLRHPAALEALDPLLGPESIMFVCAALTPDRGASIDTCLDHIAMTGNVARYLSQRPLRKCVFLSSDAVYPMIDASVDESTPVNPTGAYPVAKYTSECLMQMAFAQHPEQLLIVRPTAIFGPGDTHNSYGPNRFVRTALADHTVRLFGQGEETRDHLYIDDLTRILVDLGAADASGVLNIATGTSRSFGSIVETLRALTPEQFDIQYAPRAGAITHRQFATGRLAELFPDFQFTPFEDGLQATVRAARSAAPA
jgi:nucleoside-diphosphate-sugar epimerase